jgi:uncharacterized membrane-anchored protein
MGRTLRIPLLAIAMIAVILGMVAMYAKDLKSGTEITLKTEPVDPRSLFLGHYATLGYAINRLEHGVVGAHCYAANDAIFVTLEREDSGDWAPIRATPQMPADAFGASRVTLRGRVQWKNDCLAADMAAAFVEERPVNEIPVEIADTDAAATSESAASASAAEEAARASEDAPAASAEEPLPEPMPEPAVASIWVNYGIEQYFASPDAARRLEDLARRRAPAEGEEMQEPLEIILSVPRSGRALIKGVVIDGEKLYDQTIW